MKSKTFSSLSQLLPTILWFLAMAHQRVHPDLEAPKDHCPFFLPGTEATLFLGVLKRDCFRDSEHLPRLTGKEVEPDNPRMSSRSEHGVA